MGGQAGPRPARRMSARPSATVAFEVPPGNLPRQLTTFVGRHAEIASLLGLLGETSLVTLTGVGGVGKTRLALQVAADGVEFGDGAWFCEFGPVADPGAVWETLAASLGVRPLPGRALEESVLAYLAAKRLLLVLDGCEHLLGPIAAQVEAITQRCPGVVVLATSREALGLAGERLLALAPLPVPADDAPFDALRTVDAVRLFCDRATAAKNDFVLRDRDAAAVGVLCRRLDGIPLAIELAAARVRSISPDDLVARLDQRFRLLTRNSRATLERHQTLRGTIEWSYDLLEPREQDGLGRLSVFAGGCDLAAAEVVLADDGLDVGDVADVLAQLVNKSLVLADTTGEGPGMRYRLLETIRQYAQERLEVSGQTEAVQRRHAGYYIELAETALPHLRTRDQLTWANRVAWETANFSAVLDWAAEAPSPEHALRVVAPLAATAVSIGRTARGWAEVACTVPGVETLPLFPVVAACASLDATVHHDLHRAEVRLAAAERAHSANKPTESQVEIAIHAPVELLLYAARTILAFYQGDLAQARQSSGEAVELARAYGEPYGIASALIMHAMPVRNAEPQMAIAILEEAVRVAREAGIPSALSMGASVLAGALQRDEPERALVYFDEAIEVGTRVGDLHSVAVATQGKGKIALRRSDWHTALRATAYAAKERLQLGEFVELYVCFDMAALALCALQDPEPAALLIAKSDAARRDRNDYPLSAREQPVWAAEMMAPTRDALLEALGEEHLEALTAQGAVLDLAEAVDYLCAHADHAAPGTPVGRARPASPDGPRVFRRDGEVWTLAYDGAQVQLRDAKGLGYLARLLAQPSREIHVAELAAGSTGGEQPPRSGPAGQVIDASATRAYRDRLVDLEAELAEATEWRDPERAARAESEIDALRAQLAGAYGLGGRARTLGDPVERIRKAVTNRVRASLDRIAVVHASLGRHLANAVHTGTFCSYTPEEPLTWQVGDASENS